MYSRDAVSPQRTPYDRRPSATDNHCYSTATSLRARGDPMTLYLTAMLRWHHGDPNAL